MFWTGSDEWLTRLVFQRALATVFLIAFLNAANQFKPLLGERGLLPVPLFVKDTTFAASPSLFVFFPRDAAFTAAAWTGVALAAIAAAGISEWFGTPISMAIWALLWALYISFVNVGQTFYAFGWESILLEAGFQKDGFPPKGIKCLPHIDKRYVESPKAGPNPNGDGRIKVFRESSERCHGKNNPQPRGARKGDV